MPHQMDQIQPMRKAESINCAKPMKKPVQMKGPTPQHWLKRVPKPGRKRLKRKRMKDRMGPMGFIVPRRDAKNAMSSSQKLTYFLDY